MTLPKNSFDNIVVPPDISIFDAIDILNAGHRQIVLVVNDDLSLLGVVTDSNIRNAVLRQVELKQPVSQIMRERPVVAYEGQSDEHILNLMETTTCYQIPVVNTQNRLVDIRFLDELTKSQHENQVQVAVVMVGGKGVRLRPLTESKPKPLLEIGGKPLLFTILDHLVEAGVEKLYLALNYQGDSIREAVEKQRSYDSLVEFIEETRPLGTAGPLSLITERPNDPFIIMNGDLLAKVAVKEMMQFHRHERNVLTVALREESTEVPFGVARIEGTRILSVTEKPKHTYMINAGIYIAEPYIIERIPPDKYFDMTTLIDDLITNDLRVGSFPVHEYWSDIGTPEQLAQARQDFGKYLKAKTKPSKK